MIIGRVLYGVDDTAWAFPHVPIVSLSAVALVLLVSTYSASIARRSPRTELVLVLGVTNLTPSATLGRASKALGGGDP